MGAHFLYPIISDKKNGLLPFVYVLISLPLSRFDYSKFYDTTTSSLCQDITFFSLSFVLLMERESRSHTRYFSQQFFPLASSAIRSHRLLLYMLDIFTLYTFFVCEEIAYISELKEGYKESNWPLRDSCCCCFLAGKWWWSFVMTTPWSLSL